MPIKWRVEPLELLKEKGYSTYRIRKENLFNQSTLQNMRHGEAVSWKDLATLCELTGKQPGKLIEYVQEKKAE